MKRMRSRAVGAALAVLALAACHKDVTSIVSKSDAGVKLTDVPEHVYWGDTHLHTANSVDAFGFGNRLDPEDALRFASGEEVTSSTGLKAKLARPLDFLVITDHSDGLGSTRALYNAWRFTIRDPMLKRWYDMMHSGPQGSLKATAEIIHAKTHNTLPKALTDPEASEKRTRSVWDNQIRTVERYNQPGKFTAFIGFEWTLMNGGDNLHRNVVFRGGANKAGQVLPLGTFGTVIPDTLWDYMDAYEKKTGGKVLAIPHNANLSNGLMFMMTEPNGGPMSAAYARRRAAHEPIVEVTQIKGDSETHPFLSPNDEFAAYGTVGWDLGNLDMSQKSTTDMYAGSYVREALKRGLQIEQRTGVNPYKLGMIGSTDSHTALSTADDDNFFGKHPGVEPNPKRVMESFIPGVMVGRMNWMSLASGYAAVWARGNTRAELFDAMMRREVYATTGPRMVVRFFGGWDFKNDDLKGDWVHAGYRRGVPMGGTLAAHEGGKPTFIVSALKDPIGANLDRVQVVKGWVDKAGNSHEKVFDVAWSNPENRQEMNGKLPHVGNTVDTDKATYANTIGAPVLATVWTDPEFDPAQRAFYYLRVLQIPTPTWMDYDKVKYHETLPPEVPLTQQERGYTSPIWYDPPAE